jgi:hypothetical protein
MRVKPMISPEFQNEFQNPSKIYRPQYFWFWNHNMQFKEVTRQIEEMKKAGAGGAFLHARSGRILPYLSPEWFDICVKTAKYGQDHDFLVWLYDEDGFPSGYAGGRTLDDNPKDYAANFLVVMDEIECDGNTSVEITLPPIQANQELYAVIAAPAQEDEIGIVLTQSPSSSIDLTPPKEPDLEQRRSSSSIHWDAPNSSPLWIVTIIYREWNSNAANLLNRQAMRRFIEITHEKYYSSFENAQLSHLFGQTILGMFTDEPALMYCGGDKSFRKIVPYDKEIEIQYQKNNQVPFKLGTPFIFFDTISKDPQWRLKYWDVVGELYEESYFRQLGEWCQQHNIVLMGHVANEGNLFNQVRDQVEFFRGAKWMGYGSSDQLGEVFRADFEKSYTLANCDNMVTPRLASSSAKIYQLPRTSSECFGSAGWQLSVEMQKTLIDWQVANGVNLFYPHSYNYSIEGPRKRDHPPDFRQYAAFPHFRILNDYIGRLCYLFSQPPIKGLEGSPRIGVIHGTTTILSSMNPSQLNDAGFAHDALPYIVDLLQRLHFDFDILPESYIQALQIRSITRERTTPSTIQNQKAVLEEQNNSYDIILVPSLSVLRSETLTHLIQFIHQGGCVVFVQQLPSFVPELVLHQGLLNECISLFKISGKVFHSSFEKQEYLPNQPHAIEYHDKSGGCAYWIQAPLRPIHQNHLGEELETALTHTHQRLFQIYHLDPPTQKKTQIGEIVGRTLEIMDAESKGYGFLLFLANVTHNPIKNAYCQLSVISTGNLFDSKFEVFYLDPHSGTSTLVSELMNPFKITLEAHSSAVYYFREKTKSIQKSKSSERPSILKQSYTSLSESNATELESDQLLDSISEWNVIPCHANILNLNNWTTKFSVNPMGIERPSYLRCTISHNFSFEIESPLPSTLQLLVDGLVTTAPGSCTLLVNNKKIPPLKPGQILDYNILETENIISYCKPGINEICVNFQGGLSQEIYSMTEPLRLVGDFIVYSLKSPASPSSLASPSEVRWKITKMPSQLKISKEDLSKSGFPHYHWSFRYEHQINLPKQQSEEIYLELPRQDSPIYRILINQQEIGFVWYGNYTIKIPQQYSGLCLLQIEYFPTPLNFFQEPPVPIGLLNFVKIRQKKKQN